MRAYRPQCPKFAHPFECRHDKCVIDDVQRDQEYDDNGRVKHGAHQHRELPGDTYRILPGKCLERDLVAACSRFYGGYRGADLMRIFEKYGRIEDDPLLELSGVIGSILFLAALTTPGNLRQLFR